ncbi:MAG: hypothetical protein ABI999_06660 [Acidobacteriota bacterium]
MRRQIVLATVLAASTAVMGACTGTTVENKPENKPVVTSSPTTTPAASPSTSPGVNGTPKTNTTPEVKKTDGKTTEGNTNKAVKPAATNANHK